jgi:hypothetical protein
MNMRHERITTSSHGHTQPVGRPRHNSAKAATAEHLTELMGDDLIVKPRDAAALLGFTVGALAQWYGEGMGPKPIVIRQKRVGYRLGALKAWIRLRERAGGAT